MCNERRHKRYLLLTINTNNDSRPLDGWLSKTTNLACTVEPLITTCAHAYSSCLHHHIMATRRLRFFAVCGSRLSLVWSPKPILSDLRSPVKRLGTTPHYAIKAMRVVPGCDQMAL